MRWSTASADGTARIWNAETGVSLHILVGHEAGVRSAAFSPDGRHVLTGSSDGTARIWDATTGTPLMTLVAQGTAIYDAEFSPDSQFRRCSRLHIPRV
jgi:WD40 repeat protein